MITECKLHVVVHLEPVRHVDLEPRAPAALCNVPSQRNIVKGSRAIIENSVPTSQLHNFSENLHLKD